MAETLSELQEKMGIRFADQLLLQQALTHASYLNEDPSWSLGDNERLEYLGDAVVDFLAADYLYHRFPHLPEGELTDLRARLVCTEALARLAEFLDLGDRLRMGHGEERSGGRARASVLADALEALLGAVYLDQGLAAARGFLVPLLEPLVESLQDRGELRDAKTRLQEWSQSALRVTPEYVMVSETGPDHAKSFRVQVMVEGAVMGEGMGTSKQAAERAAARSALERVAARGAAAS